MKNAITAAIKAYAEMAKMSDVEVMQALRDGDEVVTRSIQMLVFCVAS